MTEQSGALREKTVTAICAALREALPGAEENIKWNAPNFTVEGRDLVTLNLPPKGPARVVFHRGAKAVDTKTGTRLLNDANPRLRWATDQRVYVEFADENDVLADRLWLIDFTRAWVGAVTGTA